MADQQQADDDGYYDDDEGYEEYDITTKDPGPLLLVLTIVFALSTYILLPFVVRLLTRRAYKKKQREGGGLALGDDDDDEDQANNNNITNAVVINDDQSIIRLSSIKSGNMNEFSEVRSESGASIVSLVSLIGPVLENIGPVLDNVPNCAPKKQRARTAMEKRDAELDEREGKILYVESQDLDDDDEEEANSAAYPQSIQSISLYDVDEVSFHDAVDGLTHTEPPIMDIYDGKNKKYKTRCCRYTGIYFGKLLSIVEWDYETRRIYKLGFPFFIQSLLEGTAEFGRLAIIGRLLGTKELAAYVTVDLLISFTADVLGGFSESLVTLLSHSLGCGNTILTGQYVQLSIELYVLFFIPFMILWYFVIDDTLLMFGFDQEVAQMGKDFAVPYMFDLLLEGVLAGIHGLLDVIDLEMVSTVMIVISEIVATLAVLIAALYWSPTLETIGIIYLIIMIITLLVTIVVIHLKGWFRKYYRGIFGSFALTNYPAVALMMKTASYLSAGYLLAYGEWEILAFFAKFLGPAEVAAWGILGTLWGVLEEITESISDAAEVRVATLLGAGQPNQARKSANKAIFIAFVFALVSTSCLFIAGDNLSTWLTTDPTLQMLINDLIPLFGVGNIVLTMGTINYTIVGAQGRYRLSTAIAVAGSWLITIPLAAVFSIALGINLQGQTFAVVMGYMVSGMVTNVVLLRSNWENLSKKVIDINKENERGFDDDDSSSSSSSNPTSNSEACNEAGLDETAPDIINAEDPAPPQEAEQSKDPPILI